MTAFETRSAFSNNLRCVPQKQKREEKTSKPPHATPAHAPGPHGGVLVEAERAREGEDVLRVQQLWALARVRPAPVQRAAGRALALAALLILPATTFAGLGASALSALAAAAAATAAAAAAAAVAATTAAAEDVSARDNEVVVAHQLEAHHLVGAERPHDGLEAALGGDSEKCKNH